MLATQRHGVQPRLALLALLLAPLLAIATPPAALAQVVAPPPLVHKVRAATARYLDLNVAIGEGWVPATPCVSGPSTGAMGVHFVLPSRIGDGTIDAERPEALIYEPLATGAMRLVGVEFLVLVDDWNRVHPGAGPPALDGNLLNLVSAPNRYGLPSFYELHVWAWEHNPLGSFADWNTLVTCAYQTAG